MKRLATILCLLAAASAVWAGGPVWKATSTTSATVTNAYVQGVNTALGATAATNSYTEAGMPAPVKAVVAVTNGVPYVTFGLAPICTNVPSIIGVPYQYSAFTGMVGGWVGMPTGTTTNYQWFDSGNATIPGATSSTFASGNQDGIYLRVSIANQYGTTTNFSQLLSLTRVHYRVIAATTPSLDAENLGSGYTDADVVTLDGGSFDTAATFTLTVTDGTVTAAAINNAGDYKSPMDNGSHSVTGGTGTGLKIITGDDCWELFTP